ncbi:hypothetical protein [Streptomyces sp. AS58]|uniref:hypothetical protein n=1 Tax=Streptomyces sp. AS58 TaxID=1519489 RepID=UPI001F35A626|nr:hypothetical protein [Streptomyces sp. AS58]
MALDPAGQGSRPLEQFTVGQPLFAPSTLIDEAVDKGVRDVLRQFFRPLSKQAVEIANNGLKALLQHGLTLHTERLSAGQATHAR